MGNRGWLLFNGKLKVETIFFFCIIKSFHLIGFSLIKYFFFPENIKINNIIEKSERDTYTPRSIEKHDFHIYLHVVKKNYHYS